MAPLPTLTALTLTLLTTLATAASNTTFCADGILFTAYTHPTDPRHPICTGPKRTECFPRGACNNLCKPAYTWSSIGGFPAQGQLYEGADCQGKAYTEHFDADGICFDPSGLAGTEVASTTRIRSFYVPA